MASPYQGATVNVNKNGFILGTVTLDANGQGTLMYTPNAGDVPQDSLVASLPANPGVWNAASGSATLPVNNPVLNPTVTVTPSPNPGTVGQQESVQITVA